MTAREGEQDVQCKITHEDKIDDREEEALFAPRLAMRWGRTLQGPILGLH